MKCYQLLTSEFGINKIYSVFLPIWSAVGPWCTATPMLKCHTSLFELDPSHMGGLMRHYLMVNTGWDTLCESD